MNPFFLLLACSLAVFRIAELIAVDNGPFHICKFIRQACKPHPVLCELITCQYCIGSWISIFVTTGLVIAGLIEFEHCILWWAATWGGAAAILRTVRVRE